MSKAKSTYDRSLRETEHGSRLYQHWRRVRASEHCQEFDNFPDFYNWAMENDYVVGDKLILIDCEKPYSPENCDWGQPGDKKDRPEDKKRAEEWNAVVNRIRKHFGMPPLEGTSYE